jgi:hypothetical protein
MNRTSNIVMATAAVIVLSLTTTASPAEWGAIKGRFVIDGPPPKLMPLVVAKDQFCIDKNPANESVLVGDDGSLANVVVYLRLGRRDKIDVHPDFKTKLAEPVVLDNQGCHFVPHVTLVRSGQPLILKNTDPVGHNTNVGGFNQIIPSGEEVKTKRDRAGAVPVAVTCNIHPFMKGYMLVQDHPYMATSAEDGTFAIEKIPAGKREFIFWHEAPGGMKDLKVGSAKADRRGVVELTIKANDTLDLGEIKVPSALLKVSR